MRELARRLGVLGALAILPPVHVDLARVCAGEASIQLVSNDCAAIWQAITTKARVRRVEPQRLLRRYADRHFDRTRRDARAWIPWLAPGPVAPRYWPKRWPWRPREVRRLFAFAKRVVEGRVRKPCRQDPWDWGNEQDFARYKRWNPDAVVVDCGRTFNLFVRPRP